ncbi:MAG: cyclase family protein [Halanaerobiaceae bacterium]
MLIDLTHEIVDNMPAYPGDERTELKHVKKINEDGYNNHRMEISMHSGTHIDGPMHMTESKKYISEYPLDKFIGRGCIIDVSKEKEVCIKKEYEGIIKSDSILLLYTGFDNSYGTEKYFKKYPVIKKEFVDFLVKKNIKILGLDNASPDNHPYNVHQTLFENDILIMENLKNLKNLLSVEKFEIIALPLKIKADSSIMRVVARVLE